MRASLWFHTVINLDRNKKIKSESVFIVLIYDDNCTMYRVRKDRELRCLIFLNHQIVQLFYSPCISHKYFELSFLRRYLWTNIRQGKRESRESRWYFSLKLNTDITAKYTYMYVYKLRKYKTSVKILVV